MLTSTSQLKLQGFVLKLLQISRSIQLQFNTNISTFISTNPYLLHRQHMCSTCHSFYTSVGFVFRLIFSVPETFFCSISWRKFLLYLQLVCIYVCMYLRIYVCIYVFTYVRMHVCMYVISSRLKLGNACYHSVQNLLSSRILPKNLKIKIYRTIILPVVLYGCETRSLKLREERRLRVFKNSCSKHVCGFK
jgi:hypothetical protein